MKVKCLSTSTSANQANFVNRTKNQILCVCARYRFMRMRGFKTLCARANAHSFEGTLLMVMDQVKCGILER